MPWNGSGVFNLVYSWPTDAANGLPISSTRMQGQEQDIATGLMNCLTLDGQTVPIANISWGSKKITSLAPPTATLDAANKGYVDSNTANASNGVFLLTPVTPTWTSATSFTDASVNTTSLYTPGRRVRIVHNGGLSTNYGTVASSVFTINTLTTVQMDNNVVLVTPISAMYVAVEPGIPDGLSRKSFVGYAANANLPLTATTYAVMVGAKLAYSDLFGELAAGTGIFTPVRSGIYRTIASGEIIRNGATVAANYNVKFGFDVANGTVSSGTGYSTGMDLCLPTTAFVSVPFCCMVTMPLTAGQPYRWWVGNTALTYTGGPMIAGFNSCTIEAIYYN